MDLEDMFDMRTEEPLSEEEMEELLVVFPTVLALAKALDECLEWVECSVRAYCEEAEGDWYDGMAAERARAEISELKARAFNPYRETVREASKDWFAWMRRLVVKFKLLGEVS